MGRGKSRRNRDLIAEAFAILDAIRPASIRAVCYQLFNRGLLRSMDKNATNRVSVQLRDAREQGLIPWDWVVDETREVEVVNAWDDATTYVDIVKRSYRRNYWADQPQRVAVVSEKGTVRGTLAPVLNEYGVPFQVMHGYGSATAVHNAAVDSVRDERPFTVLYVGDLDPSGLHMSEVDLPRRLARYGGRVTIERVALTRANVASGELPAFSVDEKRRDARYRWFVRRHGRRCWELDALSPIALRANVTAAIRARLDRTRWEQAQIAEQAESESIIGILAAWPRVAPSVFRGRPGNTGDGEAR